MKWKLIIAIGFLSSIVSADVTLESIFGDGMVLQRNSLANFWGKATPGEIVEVTGSWGKSSSVTTNKDGNWKLQLETPEAGGPFTVSIQGNNKITFKDVMSGEVWICTGQSNMDCQMSYFKDTKEDIAKANYPNIRLFVVGRRASAIPVKNLKGTWSRCTPQSVKTFSATGYYFGLKLYKELKIPVGLIECAWSGTRIEAWTPWEKQKNNQRLVKERARAAKVAKSYDEVTERENYREAKQKYKEAVKSWSNNGNKGPKPRTPRFKVHPFKNPYYSSSLYNGMITPLAPYTIKGAIWYQGESNAKYADSYAQRLKTMITAWREKWAQGDFPFYFVQLPRYRKAWTTPVEENAPWALMREAFATTQKTTSNTGMAITIDIGEAKDIHPQKKSIVGERLARLALHNDYDRDDIVKTGPIMKSCTFSEGKVIVTFETECSPLATCNNDKLKGFALRDMNGLFVKAEAKIINNDTIEIASVEVEKPTIVYYAWAQNPEGANLINKADLPASPFRYGKKSEINLLTKLMPEIEKKYELVYEIDPRNAKCINGNAKFVYKKDNSAEIKGSFKKIAYFLALSDNKGKLKYAFVEMDPFTDDIKKIGVPDKACGACFQIPIANAVIKSNVPEIITGDFPEGCNIEFWSCNYSGDNAKNISGASKMYDFGDSMTKQASAGYGSMQIHNKAYRQSIICFNNFKAGKKSDIGIGNSKGSKATDWTFSKNAGNHLVTELKVLVKQ